MGRKDRPGDDRHGSKGPSKPLRGLALAAVPTAGLSWFTVRLCAGLRERGFDVFNFEEYSLKGVDGVTRVHFDFNCPCGRVIHESFALSDRQIERGGVALVNQWILTARVELEAHVKGDAR